MPINNRNDDAQPFFQAPAWEQSNTPAAPVASTHEPLYQSEPLSPLTTLNHNTQANVLRSTGTNIDVAISQDDRNTTAPNPQSVSRPHVVRINSIRWLLSSPEAVRRMSAAYVTQDHGGVPVLHYQNEDHESGPSSIAAHSSELPGDQQAVNLASKVPLSQPRVDSSTRGRTRNDPIFERGRDQSSRGRVNMRVHSRVYTHLPLRIPRQLAVSPGSSAASAMDLVTQIHDICVHATRRYLVGRVVSAYIRHPGTRTPYSHNQHRRSLSPGSFPESSHLRETIHNRYRQRDSAEPANAGLNAGARSRAFGETPSSHRRTSSETQPGLVSYNLATNVSAMCTMTWNQAARGRLDEPQAERMAVDNMAALLEWSNRIVLAEQDIWRGRLELEAQAATRLGGGDIRSYEAALRKMEWGVVLGVAAAAANICVYIDDRHARGAIEALLA
ncbi:hypothetical protein BROUX41_005646 [Berkeleyomyces rouxiae]|uniref:uncharacterized protein n=1 Tax=Berkeleyomyces rouxiae TaxID=2035830 RepID=UPI003B811BB0